MQLAIANYAKIMTDYTQLFVFCITDEIVWLCLSRLRVVSHEAQKKQHACVSSGLRDHYSELFTRMAALKFLNAITQPLY